MHVADGVLSAPVLTAGFVLMAGGTALGIRKLEFSKIPKIAIMTSFFYVASLIHVPIGAASIHLMLNGLMGMVLGVSAFPAIVVALLMQYLFFQHGGISSLGINSVIMGVPALAVFYIFRYLPDSWKRLASFGCGAVAVLLSALGLAISLYLSGEHFLATAQTVIIIHLPIVIIEGIITMLVYDFIKKVKPEILYKSLSLLIILSTVMSPISAHAHRVNIYAEVKGDKVFTESFYSKKHVVKKGDIEVLSFDGSKVLLKGVTNREGKYNFKIPSMGYKGMRLVLSVGLGHRCEWEIDADEITNQEVSAVKNDKLPLWYSAITGLLFLWIFVGISFIIRKYLQFNKRDSLGENYDG